VIGLAMAFFTRLGVTRLTLKLNSVGTIASRARYIEALRAFAEPLLPEMSEDNRRRFRENALRMLDSKDERDQRLLADAPLLTDFLDDDSRAHLDQLRLYLTGMGVDFEMDPRLVRGFDYYTRTAFEIQSPDVGAQSTLAGGGRYDRLVEDLGGPPTPGIGFGLGIERALIRPRSGGRAGARAARAGRLPVPARRGGARGVRQPARPPARRQHRRRHGLREPEDEGDAGAGR
jgi:histidyl-tRNA synthetase